MTVFVFSKPNSDDLQTPIFTAGPDGNEESAMLFTKKEAAEDFRKTAGWRDEECVVGLDSDQLLKWLIELRQSGVKHLAVNPKADTYQERRTLPTLNVERQLDELATLLQKRLDEQPPAPQRILSSVKLFHCQSCGNVVERRHGNLTPTCCGHAMTLAAYDSEETTV